MGKSSALLVARKMLIKITMGYLFRIIKIVKNLFQVIMSSDLNGTMKWLSHTTGEWEWNWITLWNQFGNNIKYRNVQTLWPNHPTSKNWTKENNSKEGKVYMLIHRTTTIAVIWKGYKISLWNSLPKIPFLAQLPGYWRMTHISRMRPCP